MWIMTDDMGRWRLATWLYCRTFDWSGSIMGMEQENGIGGGGHCIRTREMLKSDIVMLASKEQIRQMMKRMKNDLT
jgi:hypothetical protein